MKLREAIRKIVKEQLKLKESGYTDCACRDCFETSMDGKLCHSCEEAGCDADGSGECQVMPEEML